METVFKVGKEYRTNEMSFKPGKKGFILVFEEKQDDGVFKKIRKEYDNVQIPYQYLKTVVKADSPTSTLLEATLLTKLDNEEIETELVYRKDDPSSKWKF